MTKTIFTAIALIFTFNLFGQFSIKVPYEEGQVLLKVEINYPANIVASDSVRLEAIYLGGFDKITEFTPVVTLKNHPLTITPGFNFQHCDYGTQSYRCIVFQKGKEPIISNEVTITYDPMDYDKMELQKVTNVQYKFIEKSGKKYIRLFWDTVPNSLGYLVAEKTGGSYYGFQLYYDGPYSKTSNTFLDIPIVGFGRIREFGVCGVQNPFDFQPEVENLSLISVDIPKK